MKALILAAGYATRLYPLTKEYPKPLLLVGERPIINYIIDKLKRIKELDEIIVITNSKFFPCFKKWGKALKINKRLSLVDDLTKAHDDRRGAIGDMSFAIKKKRIKDDLLVIGGDNLFDGTLSDFISFAKVNEGSPAIGVYNMRNKNKSKKYGIIQLDKEKRVIDFQEKPRNPKSSLVAMCLYYFPKDKLSMINKYLKDRNKKNDATGFYIEWLRKKTPVYGFVSEGRWYDIGDYEFYNEARKVFLS